MLNFETPSKTPEQLLQELMDEQNSSASLKDEVEENYRKVLVELDRARNEAVQKRIEAIQALNARNSERIRKIAELRKQIESSKTNAAYEETAKLVGEIVADYAAWKHVRHYQAEAVVAQVHAYLSGESGILNADEMGLGKTFETIVALYIIKTLHFRKHGNPPKVLWLTKMQWRSLMVTV